MLEIFSKSIPEIGQLLSGREISCEELTQVYINRLSATNTHLNALVGERFEQAILEARDLDNRFDPGVQRPPLWGIPTTVKETFSVEDMPWTAGLVGRARKMGEGDSRSVAKLRQAGAIVLGKTNVPEAALWIETNNRLYGRTNNPHDLSRTPGGSSGGEAALLAAGATLVGLGSDAGGSVRIPAHFCGVCGHKPTPGRISVHGHYPYPEGRLATVATVGPMARTIDDLKLLFDVLCEDGGDDWGAEPQGKPKVFVVEGGSMPLEAPVTEALRGAGYLLHDAGYEVASLDAKIFAEATDLYLATLSLIAQVPMSEILGLDCNRKLAREFMSFALGRSNYTAPSLMVALSDRFEPITRQRNIRLSKRLARMKSRLLQIMGPSGVLLAPVYRRTAPKHGAALFSPGDLGVSAIFNALGFPATAVPVLRGGHELPSGVQVVGVPGADAMTLSVAKDIEAGIAPWAPVNLAA